MHPRWYGSGVLSSGGGGGPEPAPRALFVFFCLIGVIAMFSGGELGLLSSAGTRRRRLRVRRCHQDLGDRPHPGGSGRLLAPMEGSADHRPRHDHRVRRSVPTLFLLAPHAFLHDVFATQVAHTGSASAGASSGVRLLTLVGFWGISFLHSETALALGFVIVLLLFVTLVYGLSAEANTRSDWFLLGSAVITTAVMFIPSSYFDHYAYFPAAFLALLIGSCAARAIRALRNLDERFVGRLGELIAPAAVSLVAIVVLVPEQLNFARGYFSVTPTQPGTIVSRLIPPGSCVVSDIVSVTILADRFDAAKGGCPDVIDPFGVWEAILPGHPQPYRGPYPESFVALWGQWLNRANDVVLVGARNGENIPWSAELTSWFRNNFRPAVLPAWLLRLPTHWP